MSTASKSAAETPPPVANTPRRMPSSQVESWGRICLAIEDMALNSKRMTEAIEKIATNTSDMADELSEIKAHLVNSPVSDS